MAVDILAENALHPGIIVLKEAPLGVDGAPIVAQDRRLRCLPMKTDRVREVLVFSGNVAGGRIPDIAIWTMPSEWVDMRQVYEEDPAWFWQLYRGSAFGLPEARVYAALERLRARPHKVIEVVSKSGVSTDKMRFYADLGIECEVRFARDVLNETWYPEMPLGQDEHTTIVRPDPIPTPFAQADWEFT